MDPGAKQFLDDLLSGKEDNVPLGDTTEAKRILDEVVAKQEAGRRRRRARRNRRTHRRQATYTGGRRRRGRATRRHYRGGAGCMGTGVGANSYEPNFNIYNTRQLQLFPYL